MKLGIMQPYFMPYIGYWQLINAVDKYVIFDDVNFIKRGWVNRNNILINGEKNMFSISLKDASQNKYFNEIYVCDDFVKFRKTLVSAYSKAPYFKEIIKLMDSIFVYEDKLLSRFIGNSIKIVLDYLGVSTELIYSSDIVKNNDLKGQEKILNICNILGASQYYNAIGGQDLYSKNIFTMNNISLSFLEPHLLEYKQFGNDFISGLSMIDVLMFNSKDDINLMLNKYNLV